MLLEPDGGRGGHDGHAVTLNRGMLWAVGGSSSLLGGPTFSLNMPTISAISAISPMLPASRQKVIYCQQISAIYCLSVGILSAKEILIHDARKTEEMDHLPETKKQILK